MNHPHAAVAVTQLPQPYRVQLNDNLGHQWLSDEPEDAGGQNTATTPDRMLLGALGDNYYVWDKSAHIEFVQPAMGEVYLDCRLSHADRTSIEAATANGEKHFPVFTVRIFNARNETIAVATRTLYIRLKKEYRPAE